jgi:hypothetical protein
MRQARAAQAKVGQRVGHLRAAPGAADLRGSLAKPALPPSAADEVRVRHKRLGLVSSRRPAMTAGLECAGDDCAVHAQAQRQRCRGTAAQACVHGQGQRGRRCVLASM